MAKLVHGLLVLYSVALLSSIAVLEIASVLLSLVAIILYIKKVMDEDISFSWPQETFSWFLILFNLAVFLSFFFSPLEVIDYSKGFGIFKITVWYFSLRFLLDQYFSPTHFERFFPFWASLCFILSVYTIFQFFTGIDLVRGPGHILEFGPFYRPTGFFSMSLTLAYALGMAGILILPWIIQRGERDRVNPYYGFMFFIVTVAMVLSLSRGLWLGLICAVTVFLFFTRSKKLTWMFVLLAIPLIGVMGANPTIQEKVMLLFDPNAANYYRLVLWEAYWEMFKDHWILGVGWQQNEALLDQYLNLIGKGDFEFRSHAHSNYFQILAGTGILGFLAFLGMLFSGFAKAFSLKRTNGYLKLFGVGFILSQLIFHVGGLTECNFTDAELTHMIISQWAVLGFLSSKGFYV